MTFVMIQYGPKLTDSQELAGDKRGRVWYPLFVFTGSTTRTDKGKGLVVQENSNLLFFWYKTGSHRLYLCFLFRLYVHLIGVSTGLRSQLLHSVRRGPRKQFRILCLSGKHARVSSMNGELTLHHYYFDQLDDQQILNIKLRHKG